MEEKWIAAYNWDGFYEVSDLGRVRSLMRKGFTCIGEREYGGRAVKPIKLRNGYIAVNLTKKGRREQISVHRLVLLSFLGLPPAGHECCHNNGVRHDSRLSNLRWDTRKNNHHDKVRHGTRQSGEKNGYSKLSWKKVAFIRKCGLSSLELAKRYNVSASCVDKVKRRETWQN